MLIARDTVVPDGWESNDCSPASALIAPPLEGAIRVVKITSPHLRLTCISVTSPSLLRLNLCFNAILN